MDVPRSEPLLDDLMGSEYLTNEECQSGFVDDFQRNHDFPEFKKFLHLTMQELSNTQRKIIYMSFWEGKSLSKQASELGLTKQAVHVLSNEL